jgi:uncharacterized protein (TIGR03067 family)
MKRFVCGALVAVLALAVGQVYSGDKAQKYTAKDLVGTYELVSGKENGTNVPAERIKGALVRFTDDTIVATDQDKKETYAAKYKLDTTQTPWKIDMVSTVPAQGQKASGLVQFEGDRVKLIYAQPGGKTPTNFTAGKDQLLLEMKRVQQEGSGTK